MSYCRLKAKVVIPSLEFIMRDPFIDQSKGILIFLVVFGHFLERLIGWGTEESRTLLSSIYAIHMPAFIFISGMLFKNKNILEKVSYFLSLLIPFQLFYLLLNYILTGYWSSTWWYQPYWILWYLLGMIFWALLLPLVLKSRYPLFIAVSAAMLIGFSPINNYILSIGRVFTFFPFFVLGHLYGKTLFEWLKQYPKTRLLGLVILIAIALVFYAVPISSGWLYGSFSYSQLNQHGLMALGTRLILMVISVVGCVALFALTPRFKFSPLVQLGQNTLAVYLLHGFVVILIAQLIKLTGTIEFNLLLCLLLSVVTCFVLQQNLLSRMIEKLSQRLRLQKSG